MLINRGTETKTSQPKIFLITTSKHEPVIAAYKEKSLARQELPALARKYDYLERIDSDSWKDEEGFFIRIEAFPILSFDRPKGYVSPLSTGIVRG